MNLYLSTHSPLRSVFTNEDGQAIYKVETPILEVTRTATISRVIPNDVPKEGEEADPDMRDKYAFTGSVEFKNLSSSRIKLGGSEFLAKSYFRKEGWNHYGR